MASLGHYINVHNTAVTIIRRKGYRVWYDAESDQFWAERDGWDFVARQPEALLGLIAIYDFVQPTEYREYWWRLEEPGVDALNLPSKPDYQPVYSRRK